MKKLTVHAIWKKCLQDDTMENFKEKLIEYGHIKIDQSSTKTCDKCGHNLPISYFDKNSESCYLC